MADGATRSSPLFLREAEIRRGIELLYFGYSSLLDGPDRLLEANGLGRAHHRALYFIARRAGMPVSELLRLLHITKQSLSRVLRDLQDRGLVQQRTGSADRRQRLLALTEAGRKLEHELYKALQEPMAGAYLKAGQQAVAGFWEVLGGLIPEGDKEMLKEIHEVHA